MNAEVKELQVERADHIAMKQIEWLWPGRIAQGATTFLGGYPGEGKSLFTLDIAARITTCSAFPDAPNPLTEPGEILFFATEDDAESVLVPRLVAAGADLSKVHIVRSMLIDRGSGKVSREVRLDIDVTEIQAQLTQHPSIRAVIIDPITDRMGQKSYLNDQETRSLLKPLQKNGVANLIVGHLNKKEGLKALQRVGGAGAFVAPSRAAWLFATDPSTKLHHMAPLKNNYAQTGGLKFEIETVSIEIEGKTIAIPRIKWLGSSSADADELLDTKGSAESKRISAVNFLSEFLWDSPQTAKDCVEEAAKKGISKTTLDRAKSMLKVFSYRADPKDATSPWMWRLPEEYWTVQ